MRVGVQLPEVERVVRWPELQDMARAAEAAGFDSIWVGDHLLYRDGATPKGPWEAWTQLAAIAASTERVEIGPLVAALPFHEPAMFAKLASTVDEISRGRLVVGVGSGWNRTEFEAFGIPFERRVSRFAEGFDIVRRLLAGEEVTFAGDHYTLERCVLLPPSLRPGGPPLMVGSNGPRMLSITLPHVTSWNSWYSSFGNDPSRIPELLRTIDDACRAVSRDPATLEKSVALLIGLDAPLGRRGGAADPIHGSDDDLVETLAAVASAGVDHVQLVLDPITLDSIDRAGRILAAYRSSAA